MADQITPLDLPFCLRCDEQVSVVTNWSSQGPKSNRVVLFGSYFRCPNGHHEMVGRLDVAAR